MAEQKMDGTQPISAYDFAQHQRMAAYDTERWARGLQHSIALLQGQINDLRAEIATLKEMAHMPNT